MNLTRISRFELSNTHAQVSFMVLGQQKSGTSSFWHTLTQHPHINTAGHRKENFFWSSGSTQHDRLRWDACLWPQEAYYTFMERDHTFQKMCPGTQYSAPSALWGVHCMPGEKIREAR